jgi:hypothetical protein
MQQLSNGQEVLAQGFILDDILILDFERDTLGYVSHLAIKLFIEDGREIIVNVTSFEEAVAFEKGHYVWIRFVPFSKVEDLLQGNVGTLDEGVSERYGLKYIRNATLTENYGTYITDTIKITQFLASHDLDMEHPVQQGCVGGGRIK